MPLIEQKDGTWFFETLYPDFVQGLKVREVLCRKTSYNLEGKKLHELMVLDTFRLGRVLTINDVVQTTEGDESYYHEPLVHCAVNSCVRRPKSALLIGCDGGTLREIRKYAFFKTIDVVDIDRMVIDIMLEYIPSIPQDSFSDPRVALTIGDGAVFVKEAKDKEKKYDIIIIDSPDPIGPARSLFETSFYMSVADILAPDGIMIRQTGSSIFQPDEMPSHFRQIMEVFPEGDVQGFVTAVPSYVGGYFTLVAASHEKGIFQKSLSFLEDRFQDISDTQLNWYSPRMHRAAMALPPEVERAIDQTEFGRHLIMDLYGGDYATISSTEKLKEFAKTICKVINMKPFGEPIVQDFGFGKSKTAGPSLVQLIETSAITGHYSLYWRLILKDIFTCSTLEVRKAVEFTMDFFQAEKAEWELKIRGKRFQKLPEKINLHLTWKADDGYRTKQYTYLPADVRGQELDWSTLS